MKIKVEKSNYKTISSYNFPKHEYPVRQKKYIRVLLKTLSKAELRKINFSYKEINMNKLDKTDSCLFLMNHSSFTDLQIAATLLSDRQFHIVCTNDGFVGKEKIMKKIGCIPAKKFITDTALVKDMKYCFDKLNSSVLMYPEASYSFDGTQTPLPDSIGKCIKLMNVPVVLIRTTGAFLRDPLYNNLQKRDVHVSATMEYILSPEDIKSLSAKEINDIISEKFQYNHFKEQKEAGIQINEPFRADGLERVLYKCSECLSEDSMLGKGTEIKCLKCGTSHKLESDGTLNCTTGNTRFEFIPDWYKWQRQCVKEEIERGDYSLDFDVNILVLQDLKCVYDIGKGRLSHNTSGFYLKSYDGDLNFHLSQKSSYSLYADYFWYEIGDMISIGDSKRQFYCFPINEKINVAKARLATEEIYQTSHFNSY